MLARSGISALVCLVLVSPAYADVTVRQKNTGKGGMGGAMSGETVQFIKGTRMRMDQTMGGDQTSTIVDAGSQKMIVLNHKKKEADVYDMAKIAQEISQATGAGDIEASITPTARTRQIAGATCTDHDVKMSVPMKMGNDTMTMVTAGVVCLAKGGPGADDFAAFYRAAAEKGLFFNDPRAAKAQPGQAKGMAVLYRGMADRGVAYATDIRMSFEGTGMMASMMNKMGGVSMSSEVLSIASDAIPDAHFDVPAGYKTRNR
ncbi:MAG TPA: hypothetical protein VK886_02485 [Vicinamibacterales bacterium]|nr:hypothetical protein [Vicinamibacterales bacterium]